MAENATTTAIVEKGDWIQFDWNSKQNSTIKWQQSFSKKQEDYIALDYSVKDKDASGSLFVQSSFQNSFLKRCSKVDGTYEIQVDKDFQYGQNNEKTMRFLVFHNKSNKPYQHRFVETPAFSDIRQKLLELGKAKVDSSTQDLLKTFIGDYLRDF